MQINFLKPVLRACNNVLINFAGLELQPGNPYKIKPKTLVPGKSTTGLISMHSPTRRASLAIVFSDAVLKHIASQTLPSVPKDGNITIDLVGEISNMILGRVKGELEDEGYDFELDLPTIMIGHNYLIPHLTESPVLRLPFASSGGPFYVEVSFDGAPISEKSAKAAAARKAAKHDQSTLDVELF